VYLPVKLVVICDTTALVRMAYSTPPASELWESSRGDLSSCLCFRREQCMRRALVGATACPAKQAGGESEIILEPAELAGEGE